MSNPELLSNDERYTQWLEERRRAFGRDSGGELAGLGIIGVGSFGLGIAPTPPTPRSAEFMTTETAERVELLRLTTTAPLGELATPLVARVAPRQSLEALAVRRDIAA